jgi:hypothetical protein
MPDVDVVVQRADRQFCTTDASRPQHVSPKPGMSSPRGNDTRMYSMSAA